MAERGALLVVGAAEGIGAAIWRLVAGGAARARGDRGRPQPRRRRGAGRRAGRTVIVADVAQEAEVAALLAQIGETPLAGAVNNAAMTQDALPVDEIPRDLFDRVFALGAGGAGRGRAVAAVGRGELHHGRVPHRRRGHDGAVLRAVWCLRVIPARGNPVEVLHLGPRVRGDDKGV